MLRLLCDRVPPSRNLLALALASRKLPGQGEFKRGRPGQWRWRCVSRVVPPRVFDGMVPQA